MLMERIVYTVILSDVFKEYPLQVQEEKSERDARKTAKKWAKEYPDKLVFIEFFRKSDGQRGYINRNGASITGRSWTSDV